MDFTVHKFVKEESESEEKIQTEFHLSPSFNGTDDLTGDVKPVVGFRDVLLGGRKKRKRHCTTTISADDLQNLLLAVSSEDESEEGEEEGANRGCNSPSVGRDGYKRAKHPTIGGSSRFFLPGLQEDLRLQRLRAV
jgi:hypothetical protein